MCHVLTYDKKTFYCLFSFPLDPDTGKRFRVAVAPLVLGSRTNRKEEKKRQSTSCVVWAEGK